MRVLVYEPGAGGGHRLTYVRHTLRALHRLGEQGADLAVVVAIGEGVEQGEDFVQQIEPFRGVGDTAFVPTEALPAKGMPRPRWRLLKPFARLLAEHRPDHVLIPTADNHAQIMGMPGFGLRHGIGRGRPAIEAALHRGAFAYPFGSTKAQINKQLALALLERSPLSRLMLVDVVAYRWIREHGGVLASIADVLPDPADDVEPIERTEARHRLALEATGRWLVSAGQQNERKGAHHLLRAYKLGRERGILRHDERLLLAGGCDQTVRTILTVECAALVADGSIAVMDRYLSDAELGDSIAAADFVVAAHHGHMGLSNIVLRSVAAGRPVVTSAYGWFEEVVPTFGIGLTVDVADAAAFAGTMRAALDRADEDWMGPKAQSLREFHSVANFEAAMMRGLRARLGMGEDGVGISWEQAVDSVER